MANNFKGFATFNPNQRFTLTCWRGLQCLQTSSCILRLLWYLFSHNAQNITLENSIFFLKTAIGKTVYTWQDTLMSHDTLTFVLRPLSFKRNLKKSVLEPIQRFFLPEDRHWENDIKSDGEKQRKIISQYQIIYCQSQTILVMTKLLGLFSSTFQVVLPARLQLQ